MKKTAWFFGCSFTQPRFETGTNNVNGIPIGNYIPWTNILCDTFNWEENNFGKGGSSTQSIVRTLIKNMSSIKSGDVVFITDTLPSRIDGVNQISKLKEIITFNADSIVDFPNSIETDFDKVVKMENKKILINYIHDFILKYEDSWIEYWKTIIFGLSKELQNRNIEVYFWSHKIWDTHPNPKLFSRFVEETNEEFIDGHWGTDGNKKFAEYMIKNITDKKYIIEYSPTI